MLNDRDGDIKESMPHLSLYATCLRCLQNNCENTTTSKDYCWARTQAPRL